MLGPHKTHIFLLNLSNREECPHISLRGPIRTALCSLRQTPLHTRRRGVPIHTEVRDRQSSTRQYLKVTFSPILSILPYIRNISLRLTPPIQPHATIHMAGVNLDLAKGRTSGIH